MLKFDLPFSIEYLTEGTTPVPEVASALLATNALTKEAVSLLPSLIDGLQVNECSLNVRTLSQESPLKEIFLISLLFVYQEELGNEVPVIIEDLFGVKVSDNYDTIVSMIFAAVVFYGASLAIDSVKKTFTQSQPRKKYEELIKVLAIELDKPEDEIQSIVEARFAKPSTVRKLTSSAKKLFLPSQRDRNAPTVFDRDQISSNLIREIPYPGDSDTTVDFDRYKPFPNVTLEIHAQDKDRAATGWAAIASSISEKRLKMKLLEPVTPEEIWGENEITADIILVSKLTSQGYTPSEIQVSKVY